MTDTFTLDEVLNGENFIITDGVNVQGRWYERAVYPAGSFAKLNQEVLTMLVEQELPAALNWVSSPKIHFVQRGVDELQRFAGIISHKLSSLNDYEKGSNKSRTKSKRIKINGPERVNGKILMENLNLMYNNLLKVAKRSIYVPENEELFRTISNLVDVVADNSNAIKDYSMRHRYQDVSSRKAENLHADEQIVATAIYRSVIGEPTAIVSGDSDIGRLLYHTVRLVTNLEMPNNAQFYDLFNQNPVFTYFIIHSGMLEPHFNTDSLKKFKRFAIEDINEPRLVRTKQRLEELSREILSLATVTATQ
ncbi:MAG: hypothetical protein Q8R00_04065 [Candidatus Nanoarchaeia archaeon]|nr:hypothetical protein [Candidatus Nanoarchaeia archaeon]